MLVLKNINVNINGKRILSDISFSVNHGVNIILGPNGSGKTTLLRAIIGMVKYSGEIRISGSVSFVPAEFSSPQMKVIDVLLSGNKRADYLYFVRELGIEEFLNREFSTLSSGEKKLVLIAKALAEGENVIMDEPLSNLDIKNRLKIIKIIKKFKKTFLITSHELDIVNYSDKIILLSKGKLVYDGNVNDLPEELISSVYGVKIRKVEIDGDVYFKPMEYSL
jgi:iron complex transport system ATP-binding protein